MSTTDIVIVVISSVSAGGYRLLRYWLRLRFLRHTFDRSGDRKDLEVAGKVTAPGWLARGDREPKRSSRPGARRQNDDHPEELEHSRDDQRQQRLAEPRDAGGDC
jgi:hypothetical protein